VPPTRPFVTKRILIGVVLVVLVGCGLGGAWWYRQQTEKKVIRGSAKDEFVITAGPEERERRPPKHGGWPMFGYDVQRTKAAPFAHRPPFRFLWTVETHAYIEFSPALVDGRAFVANQAGRFLAIDVKRRKILWEKLLGRCIASGPAVSQGVVYLGVMSLKPCHRTQDRSALSGYLLAVSAKTGKVKWRFDTAPVESSPLVVGKLVFFGSWNGRIYALDKRTGRVRWTLSTGEEINSSGAYWNGAVYFGGDGGHLFAVNARTGALRWRGSSFSRFGRREQFYPTPAAAYGRIYAANADGTVYAFGARSGHLLWARPVGSYVYTSPAVWKRRVYVGSYDGRFTALNAATGDVVWQRNVPGPIHGAPTVMAGLVYFSTALGLRTSHASRYIKDGPRGTYALDARTGKLVWRQRHIGQYAPIVADDQRVLLVGATRVYALVPRKRK